MQAEEVLLWRVCTVDRCLMRLRTGRVFGVAQTLVKRGQIGTVAIRCAWQVAARAKRRRESS